MNEQHSNTDKARRASSLDALSRTIDDLEARIEGLVSRQPSRGADERPAQSREEVGAAPDTSYRAMTDQIFERQRILDRERANLEARLAARRSARQPRQDAAPAVSEGALADIARTLVGLREDLKSDLSDGVMREIAALRGEIKALSAAGGQPLPPSMRDDLLRLSQGIEQLGRRSPDSELLDEIQSLRAAIEVFAGAAERNWSAIEQQLHEIEPQSLRGEVVKLAERLESVKAAVDALPATPDTSGAEAQLKAVASALETLAEQVNLDDAALDHRFAEMAERLDEITRAVVAVGSKAGHDEDTEALARIESRMDSLSRQMAQLAENDPTAGLGDRLDQLSLMLERGPVPAADAELAERLIEISRKIDALDPGAVDDRLAERLDGLAERIDGIAGAVAAAGDEVFGRLEALAERAQSDDRPPMPLPGMERLEERLTDIARRLDETQSANVDNNALRNLEAQLANLSSLMGQPGHHAEDGDPVVGSRLAAIEEHLATNDEYIVEAARQAAEAVIDAYSVNRGAGSGESGELAVMAELAEDLRALEEVSQRSEERTARAFDAVHDTLVKIAEHLEKLGQVHSGSAADADDGPDGPEEGGLTADEPVYSDLTLSQHERLEHQGDEHVEADPPATTVASEEHISAEMAAEEPDEIADEPARPGLLARLGRRIRPGRAGTEPPAGDGEDAVAARADVDDAPSIDPADSLEPVSLNEPLEPGSGAPDIDRIMQKVREAQNVRIETGETKTDFIAAARRAAQAAAAEVETMEGGKKRKRGGLAGLVRRGRRPILLAVGAVLLAVMSWPLVSAFLARPQMPVTADAVSKPAAMTDNSTTAAMTPVSKTVATTEGPSLPEVRVVPKETGTAADAEAAKALADTAPAVDSTGDAVAVPASVENGTPAVDEPKAAVTVAASPVKSDAAAAAPAETAPEAEPNATPAAPATPAPADTAAQPATATAASTASVPAVPAIPAAIGPQSLRLAAEKGEPAALFEIGARYTQGRGVDVDLAEAAKWYKAAAERGLAPAEYRLANFYEKGSGVGRDVEAARVWYLKAAGQGNASAMHNLAVLYAMGKDGKPDYTAAADWFRKAAEHGVKDSQFNLAVLYAQGRGVPRDLSQSYKWFAIAAAGGDHDATEKRDQVAAALKPDDLKKLRAEVSAWKPEPLDPAANSVAVPPEWSGTDTHTASIDMTKAIRNIQGILNNNGFDAGPPDGVMGDRTRSAIKAFQKSVGEKQTGEINDALIGQLLDLNRKAKESAGKSA